MKKEQWKDEVLRSMEGAKRAEPNPLLYHQIRAQLGKMEVVRRPYLALAAASLALLLSANIYALAQQSTEQQAPAATVYQIDQANFDLY
jgi:hypothetical protein